MAAELTAWRAYFDSNNTHEEPLPRRWEKLNLFQGLCVLRSVRPDKVVQGAEGGGRGSVRGEEGRGKGQRAQESRKGGGGQPCRSDEGVGEGVRVRRGE